jgi:SAM-dependent methyltransferase
MSEGASHYIHGVEPEEQARLSRLNDLLNEACLRYADPQPGQRVLDVGCGLAQLTRRLARAVQPGGRVVGIERDADQLRTARRLAEADGEADLVDLRPGEAAALPLADAEWGGFDLAHTRFLLEHVPDPLAVVRGMVRAVRPGGRIVLCDDDHALIRLWPEPPGVLAMWRAYERSYDRLGNDPFVGQRLVELLHKAGAAPEANDWVFFGACAGSPRFPPMAENFLGVLRGARPALIRFQLMDADQIDAALAAFQVWARRPDAALWYAAAVAVGRRPDTGGKG